MQPNTQPNVLKLLPSQKKGQKIYLQLVAPQNPFLAKNMVASPIIKPLRTASPDVKPQDVKSLAEVIQERMKVSQTNKQEKSKSYKNTLLEEIIMKARESQIGSSLRASLRGSQVDQEKPKKKVAKKSHKKTTQKIDQQQIPLEIPIKPDSIPIVKELDQLVVPSEQPIVLSVAEKASAVSSPEIVKQQVIKRMKIPPNSPKQFTDTKEQVIKERKRSPKKKSKVEVVPVVVQKKDKEITKDQIAQTEQVLALHDMEQAYNRLKAAQRPGSRKFEPLLAQMKVNIEDVKTDLKRGISGEVPEAKPKLIQRTTSPAYFKPSQPKGSSQIDMNEQPPDILQDINPQESMSFSESNYSMQNVKKFQKPNYGEFNIGKIPKKETVAPAVEQNTNVEKDLNPAKAAPEVQLPQGEFKRSNSPQCNETREPAKQVTVSSQQLENVVKDVLVKLMTDESTPLAKRFQKIFGADKTIITEIQKQLSIGNESTPAVERIVKDYAEQKKTNLDEVSSPFRFDEQYVKTDGPVQAKDRVQEMQAEPIQGVVESPVIPTSIPSKRKTAEEEEIIESTANQKLFIDADDKSKEIRVQKQKTKLPKVNEQVIQMSAKLAEKKEDVAMSQLIKSQVQEEIVEVKEVNKVQFQKIEKEKLVPKDSPEKEQKPPVIQTKLTQIKPLQENIVKVERKVIPLEPVSKQGVNREFITEAELKQSQIQKQIQQKEKLQVQQAKQHFIEIENSNQAQNNVQPEIKIEQISQQPSKSESSSPMKASVDNVVETIIIKGVQEKEEVAEISEQSVEDKKEPEEEKHEQEKIDEEIQENENHEEVPQARDIPLNIVENDILISADIETNESGSRRERPKNKEGKRSFASMDEKQVESPQKVNEDYVVENPQVQPLQGSQIIEVEMNKLLISQDTDKDAKTKSAKINASPQLQDLQNVEKMEVISMKQSVSSDVGLSPVTKIQQDIKPQEQLNQQQDIDKTISSDKPEVSLQDVNFKPVVDSQKDQIIESMGPEVVLNAQSSKTNSEVKTQQFEVESAKIGVKTEQSGVETKQNEVKTEQVKQNNSENAEIAKKEVVKQETLIQNVKIEAESKIVGVEKQEAVTLNEVKNEKEKDVEVKVVESVRPVERGVIGQPNVDLVDRPMSTHAMSGAKSTKPQCLEEKKAEPEVITEKQNAKADEVKQMPQEEQKIEQKKEEQQVVKEQPIQKVEENKQLVEDTKTTENAKEEVEPIKSEGEPKEGKKRVKVKQLIKKDQVKADAQPAVKTDEVKEEQKIEPIKEGQKEEIKAPTQLPQVTVAKEEIKPVKPQSSLSEADKKALDRIGKITAEDVIKQVAKEEEQKEKQKGSVKSSVGDLAMGSKQQSIPSSYETQTIPDFQKAQKTEYGAFFVPSMIMSRAEYQKFTSQFLGFIENPVGYEIPFEQIFTKQSIIICDFLLESLKQQGIQLISTQGKKNLNTYEDINDQQQMMDLVAIQIVNGTLGKIKMIFEQKFSLLQKKQNIENAVLNEMNQFEKEIGVDYDKGMEYAMQLAEGIMDDMLGELAYEAIQQEESKK